MLTQYHLKGKGFSGRAVRVRELDALAVSQNLTDAARLVDKEASIIELKKVEWRNGIKLMIAEYTDPCEDPFAEGVKWRTPKPDQLEDLGSLFKSKDLLLLEAVYREMHEVLPSEMEAITGKALPVQSAG